MNKKYLLGACATIALLGYLGPTVGAFAKTKSAALEEIVVTAQKRRENLQTVPIMVTAVSAAALANDRVDTTQDLQFLAPTLVYTTGSGYAQPYLRGIGSDFTQPNADPSVATYIDGAFVANDQATIQSLLGVDRVEVLEGPQGTLYGRNAVGGAISVTTLTPTQKLDEALTLTTGNYARKEGSGHISGGITDKLAIGLYAAGTERNNYISVTGPKNPDTPTNAGEWGARVKAVYTPTDAMKFTFSAERTETSDLEDNALRSISSNALGKLIFPGSPVSTGPYNVAAGYPIGIFIRQTALTLREEYDLNWAQLVGITNYRHMDQYGRADASSETTPILGAGSGPSESRQWSQEVQLLSPSSSKVNWIAGLFIFHERGGFLPNYDYSDVIFNPPVGEITKGYGLVDTDSFAGYGQTTFPLDDITKGLRLTLGARYTVDEKTLRSHEIDDTFTGVQLPTSAVYPDSSHNWYQFTPRLEVDYTRGGTLYYASYSKGYKSGVYNLSSATQSAVAPEKLNAYETGAKATLFGGKVRWNSAAYFYDYQDLQASVTTATLLPELENAASARAYGVESSLITAVTSDLRLHATVAWEHARYVSYPNANSVDLSTLASDTADATGHQMVRAPVWVGTIGADYVKELAIGGTVAANTELYYNSGYPWTPTGSLNQGSYILLNANVGYTLPGDRWTVSLWGKNLTNKLYEESVTAIAALGVFAYDAPPRMFGLTVSYKYN